MEEKGIFNLIGYQGNLMGGKNISKKKYQGKKLSLIPVYEIANSELHGGCSVAECTDPEFSPWLLPFSPRKEETSGSKH